MTQVSIEINGNLHFPKFDMVKLFELKSLQNVGNVENLLLQAKNILLNQNPILIHISIKN